MNTNLFIDLDGVVMEMARFIADFKRLLVDSGVTAEALNAFYASKNEVFRQYRSATMYLLSHPETVKALFGIQDTDKFIEASNALLLKMPEYLFDDALPFLKAVDDDLPFLVVTGGREWQELKIHMTKIATKFLDIVIADGLPKTDAILELRNSGQIVEFDGLFIDDREKEIVRVKQVFPNIRTVLLNRPKYDSMPDKNGTAADFVAGGLDEVLSILKRKKAYSKKKR